MVSTEEESGLAAQSVSEGSSVLKVELTLNAGVFPLFKQGLVGFMCSVSPPLEHHLIVSHNVTTTKESYRLTLAWKDLKTLYRPSSP